MSLLSRPATTRRGIAIAIAFAGVVWPVSAQESADDADSGPEHAVIERMALELRDPREYQVPLHLDPVKSIELVARLDGVVNNVMVEPGESVTAQEEVVRMDSTIRQLEFERAQAAFHLAQLENAAAAESQSSDVAAARLDVARLGLRLAEERLNETIVRANFNGTITDVHVTGGQFVRAGDPLVTLSDLTRFTVAVPVSRNDVSEGDSIDVRVEDRTVPGKVTQILPLSEKFEPLRELFMSVATARVEIGGNEGLSSGQTVYSDMIPRHPVAEIPKAALLDTDDGRQKVQVIREEYVRDVGVLLLGGSGEEHVFVSGRFGPADELVVKTSEPLLDGARVVPASEAEAQQGRGPAQPAAGVRGGF